MHDVMFQVVLQDDRPFCIGVFMSVNMLKVLISLRYSSKAMQMASSPYEVPNSDPYAPPEDLPILLGCDVSHHDPNRPDRKGRKPLPRSDVFRTAGDQHESDDIVPDSDPPYPDWLPPIVPRGWPLSDGSNNEPSKPGTIRDSTR